MQILRHRGIGIGEISHERNNISPELQAAAGQPVALSTDGNAESFEVLDTVEAPDNPDPLKARIPVIRQRKGLARLIHNIRMIPVRLIRSARPELTEEQIQAREDQKFLKVKRTDVVQFARRVIGRLTQLEFMNINYETGKRQVHRVHADMLAIDREARTYMMSFQIRTLPPGVKLTNLVQEETLSECLPSVGFPVRGELGPWGVIYTGHPAGSLGLPELVTIKKIWEKMGDQRAPLEFCAGESYNGALIWKDLGRCPHLLVTGGTEQGKSNAINEVLCTFIQRNNKHEVQLVLFDMKEGMEFTFYEKVPHLYIDDKIPGIIDDPWQAQEAMKRLIVIMKERMNIIKDAGYKNYSDYRSHKYGKNRIPYMVIVFDEIASLLLLFKNDFESELNELTNKARAAGMHIIIGSQYPRADILTTLVTINLPVRLAFNMTEGASMSVLGNHHAAGLPCKGRAILQAFGDELEVQVPLISDDIVRAVVHKAITGKEVQANTVSMEKLLTYAYEHLEGKLLQERLFEAFRKEGLRYQHLVRMLKEADGQEFQLGAEYFRVVPKRGRNARYMERVSDSPNDPENLQIS
jgi:DNA segregation ATPase FtsK/SpoIIIE-like protein